MTDLSHTYPDLKHASKMFYEFLKISTLEGPVITIIKFSKIENHAY